MKIIIKHRYGALITYVDGRPYGLEKLAELCNITVPYLRRAMERPDRLHKINEWVLKAKEGINPKSRTYYHKKCPMWLPVVMEETGCKVNAGTFRLMEWIDTGDYDKLFRPKTPGRGPKKGSKYRTKKTGSFVDKPEPKEGKVEKGRIDINALPSVGTWESKNL